MTASQFQGEFMNNESRRVQTILRTMRQFNSHTIMKRTYLIATLIWLSQTLCLAQTSQVAHKIELPLNSSILLPTDWVVQQGDRKVRVEEYATQMLQSSGVSPLQLAPFQQILIANYPSREKYAGLTVVRELNPKVSRGLISSMTQNDIAQTGAAVADLIKRSLASAGISTRDWSQMTRVKIGNRDALMISCVRVSTMPDTRQVQYMFSGDGVVFFVTVSTVISNEGSMTETLLGIVRSFAF